MKRKLKKKELYSQPNTQYECVFEIEIKIKQKKDWGGVRYFFHNVQCGHEILIDCSE